MCDFCLNYFHPECIGLHAGPAVLQAMPSFKCIECEKSGRTSPLYNEGISIYGGVSNANNLQYKPSHA